MTSRQPAMPGRSNERRLQFRCGSCAVTMHLGPIGAGSGFDPVASAQLCYPATKVRKDAEWLSSLVLAAHTFLASAEEGRSLGPGGIMLSARSVRGQPRPGLGGCP